MSKLTKGPGAAGMLSVALGVASANAQTATTSQGSITGSTTTRAKQKQQLKTLEQNGYRPGAGDDPQYPNGTGPQAQPGAGTH
jgi:hypothetical protein